MVRNDKLGDFMLAWPALAMLKAASPQPHISVLVPGYTAPMAEACPWVDAVIVDPGDAAPRRAQCELLGRLREQRFDALLTLFSTPRIGWLGWRAGIRMRMAPATKWAQIFYNQRIAQRRSHSAKPEYRYNQELAGTLIDKLGLTPAPVAPPYWPDGAAQRPAQRQRLAEQLPLTTNRHWCFLHPGSGGSAVNLSLSAYARLVDEIDHRMLAHGQQRPQWIITAGPGEEQNADSLVDTLVNQGASAFRQPPQQGLAAFALSLAAADIFIAGSTGPLHVAGCLDLVTAGFYPARRSATPLRWQTCNGEGRRLAFHPPPEAGETDMSTIDLDAAATEIAERLTMIETSSHPDCSGEAS
ncbi:hypothetical protein BJB45_20675 [Halomonas huangheensis]|uniref:Uncharacterized protein n=1 Tax=Halomonas huangheensis TaxID=1178482 RepID=W1N7X6_9GAMM|nr:hypothetical protein BJB45_20675 [Halomonas huangheensis]